MKTKPDWKDAPKWARYTAMNSDGSWIWFEYQPFVNHYINGNDWNPPGGKQLYAGSFWENSLEKRY